jgi:hypothetical protein
LLYQLAPVSSNGISISPSYIHRKSFTWKPMEFWVCSAKTFGNEMKLVYLRLCRIKVTVGILCVRIKITFIIHIYRDCDLCTYVHDECTTWDDKCQKYVCMYVCMHIHKSTGLHSTSSCHCHGCPTSSRRWRRRRSDITMSGMPSVVSTYHVINV